MNSLLQTPSINTRFIRVVNTQSIPWTDEKFDLHSNYQILSRIETIECKRKVKWIYGRVIIILVDALTTGFARASNTGLILGLRPANERRRYKVTPSLIGWAST